MTERITQIWPSGLKGEVNALVGNRKVTAFTVAAVQEKLSKEAPREEASAPAPPESPQAQHPQPPAEGDYFSQLLERARDLSSPVPDEF